MASGNAVLVNFSGGETDPKGRGRFDAPWYATAARKILNFIAETLGPARYRPGFIMVAQTRRGAVGRMVPFQISNSIGYLLEFTPGFMRVYLNDALLIASSFTITGISNASTGVVTVSAIGTLANGNEVILSGIVGMPQLNGRQVLVAGISGNTFQIQDPVTGVGINTSGLPAYGSGGLAGLIYEIATSYLANDLPSLQFTGDGASGTMYFTSGTQPAQKLTVDSANNFTLGTFSRTNDPFTAGTAINLVSTSNVGVWRSNHTAEVIGQLITPGYTVVLFPAGTVVIPGALYTFSLVTGTVEINGGVYQLVPFVYNDAICNVVIPTLATPVNAVMCLIQTAAGANVDSSAWTAYTGAGKATPAPEYPISCTFYEGRLIYAGTNRRPACLFLSRSPDGSGNQRYDDFTGGTAADNACFFQLAPVGGSNDFISWARGGPDYLFIGTFGGPFRVSGSGLDIPITPSSINVRQFDTAGCEQTVPAGLSEMFFIRRGGASLQSIKVINPYLATFESDDLTLNAQQIAYSPLQRVVLQQGRPDILWVIRADGILCGMSVHITAQAADEITGWHRHAIGGTAAGIKDLATLQRTTALDQLWVMTQRTVNGVKRTFVEFMADDVTFPDKEDFFSDNKAADLAAFRGAVYRKQEEYIHLDAASTYDGTARGAAAGATLTPGATTGTAVTFTASQNVFTAADVGNELWKKPDAVTGLGAGRAVITAYTDAKHVTCDIDDNGVAFDSAAAIAAGAWHIATKTIYGLAYLEGQQVAVVTDGAVYSDGIDTTGKLFPTVTVVNGTIALDANAGMVHVGLPYLGLLQTHNLEMGGRTGPAQDKPRNIAQMFIRLMNTLGVQFGTDIYKMDRIEQRPVSAAMDRPAPVFSGIRKLQYSDTWQGEKEKHVVVMQRLPLPAVVESIDVHYSTGDEGEDQ